MNLHDAKELEISLIIPAYLRNYHNPFGPTIYGYHLGCPNHYTFRRNENEQFGLLFIINLFPAGADKIVKDIGIKLLSYKDNNGDRQKKIDLDTIINNTQRIIITEYVLDTKIDLVWSVFKYAVQGFDDAMNKREETDDNPGLWKKRAHATAYMLKKSEFWQKIFESACIDKSNLLEFFQNKKDVIDFVFCFYYRMMSKTPTNRYVFPNTDENIFNTDGSSGWPNGSPWGNMKSSGNSTIGKLINYLGGSIRIISEPVWLGNTGSSNQLITLKCDLFNDTAEHALNNFLLVHTLFPNNMFMLYMVFLQPPSVYDVKIDGGPRLFMCSGSFKCTSKGILRTPSDWFFDDLASYTASELDSEYLKNNDLIRIPDVYSLELTFKSLLPDSFNQYILRYAITPDLIINEFNKENFAVESAVATLNMAKKVLEDKYNNVDTKEDSWEQKVENQVNTLLDTKGGG